MPFQQASGRHRAVKHKTSISQFLKETVRPSTENGLRSVILKGVFLRLALIEAVVFVWILAYFKLVVSVEEITLFQFAKRIVMLQGLVLCFMIVSLGQFLQQRVIGPLETISRANREQGRDIARPNKVPVPRDTPTEIREIVASRTYMLRRLFKSSEDRLQLIRYLRETFGRYYSDKILDEILKGRQRQRLGGKQEEVSILMCDIRGFSRISEEREPKDLVNVLNTYFAHMSEVIIRFDGIIDEFQGDGILAFFRNSADAKDHAGRAVACAIAMQNDLPRLNQELEVEKGPVLRLGIAVNTGVVVVGNIGSAHRMKYGLVGAPVNETARIESQTSGGEVMIGQETFQYLENLVRIDRKSSVQVKGLSDPVNTYSVVSIGPPFEGALGSIGPLLTGVARFAFEAFAIVDNVVTSDPIGGKSLRMGPDLIVAELESPVTLFTAMKLDFEGSRDCHLEGVYVKVFEIEQKDDVWLAKLRISSLRSADREFLSSLIAA